MYAIGLAALRLIAAIAKVFCLIAGGGIAVLLALWSLSFIDTAPAQDKCAFGSVTNDEYRYWLRRAKAQHWTVFPGLFTELLLPDPGFIMTGAAPPETEIGAPVLRHIQELAPERSTADKQLAAAHAVMRSIGAEYVRVSNVPDFRQNGRLVSSKVGFTYFLPQRRFFPLCVFCFLWPHATLQIAFHHDFAANTHTLQRVGVLFSDLKYAHRKESDTSRPCPAFPSDEPLFKYQRRENSGLSPSG